MSAYQFRFSVVDNISSVLNGIGAQFGRVQQDAQRFVNTTNQLGHQSQKMQNGFGALTGTIGKLVAVAGVGAFAHEAISAFTDWEKTTTVLEASLGKVGLTKTIDDLTKFANDNGQSITSVQDSYVGFVSRGIVPTMNQMRQLTDFALKSKKPLNQFMEAILDSQTGEQERLKEFGVTAKKVGNGVAMTYMKQTTMIGNDADSIMNYLLKLGDRADTKGLGEKMSNTLGGSINKMKNNFQVFEVQIAGAFAPLLNDVLPVVSDALGEIGKFFRDNKETISSWIGGVKGTFTAVVSFLEPLYIAIRPTLIGLANLAMNAVGRIKGFIIANQENFAKIRDTIGWLVDKIGKVLIPTLDWLMGLIFRIGQILIKVIVGIIDLFTALGKAGSDAFQWVIDKVSWFSDMIYNVANSIFPNFTAAFIRTKDWLYNSFIKPIADWFSALFKFDVSVSAPEAVTMAQKTADASKSPANAAAKGNNVGVQNKLDSVSGDKGKMTNVYIKIDSLVKDGIHVHTVNLREGLGEIKEAVIAVLLDATNQLNYTN